MIAARGLSLHTINPAWIKILPAVQGISGGGIITLKEILTSGFVPLAERGVYQGVIGLT
ncbi:hypothetical protein B0H10DRAFT_1837323 [Mycena sp. CBHHK59/15]|nr:hypothetical protein B0H10DRAFT_1837323 [Mycena sp. CBHHK59/15]